MTDKETDVLANAKELKKERATTAKENLIEKMRVKNLDENVLDTFKKMKNFRKDKISFGKVKYFCGKLIFI